MCVCAFLKWWAKRHKTPKNNNNNNKNHDHPTRFATIKYVQTQTHTCPSVLYCLTSTALHCTATSLLCNPLHSPWAWPPTWSPCHKSCCMRHNPLDFECDSASKSWQREGCLLLSNWRAILCATAFVHDVSVVSLLWLFMCLFCKSSQRCFCAHYILMEQSEVVCSRLLVLQ
jgi:hypothetical protein